MKKTLSLLLLASILFLSSCHKYEDGPLFSFKSAKARVSYDWKLTAAFKNEVDTVTNLTHFGVKLDKSDAVTYTDTITDSMQHVNIYAGTWQLTNSDANIAMVLNPPGTAQIVKIWYILRLDDELWVREQIGSDYFEYHFVHR